MTSTRARAKKAVSGTRRSEGADAAKIEAYSSPKMRQFDENTAVIFSAFVFVAIVLAVMGIGYVVTGTIDIWILALGIALAVLSAFTVRVAPQ